MRWLGRLAALLSLTVCLACRSASVATAPAPSDATKPPPPPPPLETPEVAAPAQAEDVAAVVEFLLRAIADSGLTFIRNGTEHSAAKAAEHIRDKYERVRDEIRTPEDFIAKAATSSWLSGQPYLVKLPDGSTVPAADWLREKLTEYRART